MRRPHRDFWKFLGLSGGRAAIGAVFRQFPAPEGPTFLGVIWGCYGDALGLFLCLVWGSAVPVMGVAAVYLLKPAHRDRMRVKLIRCSQC